MAAMKKKMYGISPIGFGLDMKKETMKSVFQESPYKYSRSQYQTDLRECVSHLYWFHGEVTDDRQPNDWNNPPYRTS